MSKNRNIYDFSNEGFQEITTIDRDKIGINIFSDKIILTNERKAHIYKDHPNDFYTLIDGLKKTIDMPKEIWQDARNENTIYYIRKKSSGNQNVIVRLNTTNDIQHPHNSIISSWLMNENNTKRFLKNKKNIYIDYKK